MGGQGLVVILEKKKSRCRVCKIWPLNITTMVGKFCPNKVFITIEKEGT
jgi:hypothetical protein